MNDVMERSRTREMISFLSGGQDFCIEINAVREIRGWTMATPMPYSPHYILGVINLRGKVMPVVDLAARLGLGNTDATERHVIIVVIVGDEQVGILVDAVRETINVTNDQIQPAPELAGSQTSDAVEGMLPLDGRIVSVLAIDKVLHD